MAMGSESISYTNTTSSVFNGNFMITGQDRRSQYQLKYPGKTMARRSAKEQKEIKEHNKRFFDEIMEQQKEIKATKIRKAKELQDEAVKQIESHFSNKVITNPKVAEAKVSEVIDSLKKS